MASPDLKHCTSCDSYKSFDDFHKNNQARDGRNSRCKPCRSAYVKANRPPYTGKSEAMKRAQKKSWERNQKFMGDYLATHPCVDCGNTDIRLLDFDHITNDKQYGIGTMVSTTFSIARIEAEIAKCEVRCANCHRLKTWERLGGTWRDKYYQQQQQLLLLGDG